MRRASSRLRMLGSTAAITLVVTACASGSTAATDELAGDVLEVVGDVQQQVLPVDGPTPSEVTKVSSTEAATDASAGDDRAVAAEPSPALWWTAETLDGQQLVAADLAGQDVVLWMWAPWCSVCNREAPDVARALADLPDGVTLVGVAGRDEVDAMQEFVAEHGLQEMTNVVDADGEVWASYGVSYQPAWVFIPAGGAASVAAGSIGYDGLFAGMELVFGGR